MTDFVGWERKERKMQTQSVKRILSRVKPEFNNYFTCWFDPIVHVVEEVQEAKKDCKTNQVVCDHQPDQDAAIVVARGAFVDQNKRDVECVRIYLLKHGWKEGEE